MEVLDIGMSDKTSWGNKNDFYVDNMFEIYAKSEESFQKYTTFTGIKDLNSYAEKEVSNINGQVYPARDSYFFMEFSKDYISFNCSENAEWIKRLQFWIPIVVHTFIRQIIDIGINNSVNTLTVNSLTRWYEMFSENGELEGSDFISLAIAMLHNINVRDAMLITILDEKQEWYDKNSLLDFAIKPHTKEISSNLRNCLEEKFAQIDEKPNIERAEKACKVLQSMMLITSSIPELSTQIYALLSYISWWFNLGNVKHYTDCALKINPDCSMAKIVRGAAVNDLQPAWLEHFGAPEVDKNE